MSLLGRLFGRRNHDRPEPTEDDVARIDIAKMIATAVERGDRRTEPEVVAALLLGADQVAVGHPDADLRLRAAAAYEACRRWLLDAVGEDVAARLISESAGPIDEQGRMRRPR